MHSNILSMPEFTTTHVLSDAKGLMERDNVVIMFMQPMIHQPLSVTRNMSSWFIEILRYINIIIPYCVSCLYYNTISKLTPYRYIDTISVLEHSVDTITPCQYYNTMLILQYYVRSYKNKNDCVTMFSSSGHKNN